MNDHEPNGGFVRLDLYRRDLASCWTGAKAATSRVERWRAGPSGGFNVAVIDPAAGHDETVLYPMSQDYRIDPMVVRRLQVLATLTNRRFIGVDLPGVTMNYLRPEETPPSRVPVAATWLAMTGDYRRLASMQLEAARDIAGDELPNLRLLGESLGAQLVTSLLTTGAISPLSIDLVEPVNPTGMTLLRLLRVAQQLITVEAELKTQYLEENTAAGWGDITAFELSSLTNASIDKRLKSWARQGRHANLPALGLTRGLRATLEQSPPRCPLTLWHADSSTVSPADGCHELVNHLRGADVNAEMIEMRGVETSQTPVGHHVLSSLPRLGTFARLLKERWSHEA